MQLLKADTLTKVLIGPVVAVGDGFTPVTTLSLSTADEAELLKHDAAAVTDISSNTFAAITSADGYYNLTITAAQLDTEGRLTVLANDDSLCLPVRHDFMVVNANVYDSLYGAATTDYLQVDSIQISGDATAADNLELQYDGTGLTGDTYPATQQQIGSLSVGSGGISVVQDSFTATSVGTQTNTAASTEELDGVYHICPPTAGTLDARYNFNVGISGVATEVIWDGYVQSNADVLDVYAYDYIAAAFKQIGSINGANGTTHKEQKFILTSSMTGTGANAGDAIIQFYSTGGTVVTNLATDRLLVEYTRLPDAGVVLHSGIAQAGSSNTITLDAGANATDDYYNHARVLIVSGTGDEQERIIVDYNGTTKVATIAPPWVTTPDTTSAFEVEPALSHAETGWATIKVGTAAAGTSTTITLDANASATDDYYNNDLISIDHGTGEGQGRVITDYVGATKVATVDSAWTTTPDTTSEYIVQQAKHVTVVNSDKTGYELSATGADLIPFDSTFLTASAKANWSDTLTTYTNGQAGKRLKGLSAVFVVEGTVSTGSTTTVIQTDVTGYPNDIFVDTDISIELATDQWQTNIVTAYNGTTGQFTVDEEFVSSPANTDAVVLRLNHTHSLAQIQSGLATEAKQDIIDTNIDSILADTSDMQPKLGAPAGADMSADIAAIKADTAAILIDTNELQGDWTNGGRLDLIIDAINTSTAAVTLSSSERNAIADAMLDRDMSIGTDSGSTTVRTVRQSLRSSRNKVTIAAGTMTVYKENDTTASWTAAITTTAGNPISDMNPAG